MEEMRSLLWAGIGIFIGFCILCAVWLRWRHQNGGGWGPTEFGDGSMSVAPTGYPEEMKGHAHKIGPTDNNAAGM